MTEEKLIKELKKIIKQYRREDDNVLVFKIFKMLVLSGFIK